MYVPSLDIRNSQHLYTDIHTYICTYVRTYVCMYAQMYICTSMGRYVRMYTYEWAVYPYIYIILFRPTGTWISGQIRTYPLDTHVLHVHT